MKRPSFPFYPGDWMGDPALQVCSLAAQGLWVKMMCLMHTGYPYGYLTLPNAEEITVAKLAKISQISEKFCEKLLKELAENGVFSCDINGVIFSKRMVADEAQRQDWRERQQKHRDEETCDNPRDVTPDVTQKSRPMSSSSSISTKELALFPSGKERLTKLGASIPQTQPEVFPSGKEPLTSLGVLSPSGKERLTSLGTSIPQTQPQKQPEVFPSGKELLTKLGALSPSGKERLTSLGTSIPQTQPEVFPSGKELLTSLGASAFVPPSENAARDIVWADGLELLMSSGEDEKAARRLLGMMVKKYTKEVVEEAILDTVVKKTGDPRAYLNGILKGMIKKTRDTHGFKTVQEWENHKALFEGGI